jgi:hypothetical protein
MRALIATLALALPAAAQTPQCTGLPDALAALAAQYGEHPRVSGLTYNGSLFLMTAAENGGWSVLLVSPDGRACMVASGAAFEVIEPEAPGVDG